MNEQTLLIISYLIGAIPFGLIMGKIKGIDLRQHGSKNLGATNAVRVLGKPLGITVFILDFLKGATPVWIACSLLGRVESLPWIVGCGFAAIMGHVFPIYLKFKGGKGVATSAGVLVGLAPAVLGIALVIWGVVFFISRMVSAASIVATLAAAGLQIYLSPAPFGSDAPVTGLLILVALIIVWRHRSNVVRIIKGEENRFEKKEA